MKVNGVITYLDNSQSLYDFLLTQSYDVHVIAVERNGEIVPRINFKSVLLCEEDILEIVRFVGGG